MNSKKIYVWSNGAHDISRWVTVAHRGSGNCVFQLSDLCQPGLISRLNYVSCPTEYLSLVGKQEIVQITLANGFLVIQRIEDAINLEFRGRDEGQSVKGSFKAAELLEAIRASDESTKLALTS